jgi:hypothetical protein
MLGLMPQGIRIYPLKPRDFSFLIFTNSDVNRFDLCCQLGFMTKMILPLEPYLEENSVWYSYLEPLDSLAFSKLHCLPLFTDAAEIIAREGERAHCIN